MNNSEVKICVSSGWMFDIDNHDRLLDFHNKVLENSDGLEFHITNKSRRKFYTKIDKDDLLLDDKRITFHAPSNIDNCFSTIRDLVYKYDPESILIHPSNKRDIKLLSRLGTDVLIENMDINKNYGISINYLSEWLFENNFGLCVDLQHCYEIYDDAYYASLIRKYFGKRVEQIHFSGRNEINPNHSLVYKSENKNYILKILDFFDSSNFVIEGSYSGIEDINKEIGVILEKYKGL